VEPRHGDDKPHTPTPSIWPVGFAVGIACILAGLVVSTPAVIAGVVIAVVFGALWARDAMRAGRREPAVPASAEAAPTTDEEQPDQYPRNVFLEMTTLALGGVITAIVSVPIVGFAILPAFTKQEAPGVDLGPVDNFPEGEWIEATFLSEPSLGEVSARTAFVRFNGTVSGDPNYTIISNRCVHLGCPTAPSGPKNEEERKTVEVDNDEISLTPVLPAGFSCPCHGGAYDTEGNRTAGPPVRALDRYLFAIIDGRLVLGDRYSVGEVVGEGARAEIHSYGLQGPGEHVDGLSGWLYPIQPQDLR
jgi:menaquinol-cytochrome c reductase iron-sulfur subunit